MMSHILDSLLRRSDLQVTLKGQSLMGKQSVKTWCLWEFAQESVLKECQVIEQLTGRQTWKEKMTQSEQF